MAGLAGSGSQRLHAAAVVDASVWISRFLPSEVNSPISRAWLHGQLSAGALLGAPSLLLVEVGAAIARRTQDERLATQITQSLEHEPQLLLVDVDRALIAQAYAIGIRLRLRAADAVYVAVAQRLGVPLYSWDGELIARASALAPTI